jgi:CBS domain-containing protein
MNVSDIMTGKVITVGQDEPVMAAVRLLKRHNVGALPVTDQSGRLRGLVTDRDIVLRCVAAGEDVRTMPVNEIMSRGILTAQPGDSVAQAAESMAREQIRRLPVTENGRVVGMVSLCDLARQESCRRECTKAVESISANIKIR